MTAEAPAEVGSQRRSFQWYWGAPKSGEEQRWAVEEPSEFLLSPFSRLPGNSLPSGSFLQLTPGDGHPCCLHRPALGLLTCAIRTHPRPQVTLKGTSNKTPAWKVGLLSSILCSFGSPDQGPRPRARAPHRTLHRPSRLGRRRKASQNAGTTLSRAPPGDPGAGGTGPAAGSPHV